MRINFIGSPTVGYVGETSDESHLVRELREVGHEVNFIPRDIWKAHCDDYTNPDWDKYLTNLQADINIICKWPHLNHEKYITVLRDLTNAPVFYWVWDYMADDPNESFNTIMARAADLYLTNEGGADAYYRKWGAKPYYFPFDCADNSLPVYQLPNPQNDVAFFGSYFGKGDRVEWLKAVREKIPLRIYSWNWENWVKEGFDAHPAVWGEEFNRTVANTKICLQFSVNDHTWGYWSNRTGKVLMAGGFLLARYAPGMELFLRDGAEYFSSVDELVEKVDYYLIADTERAAVAKRGYEIGQDRFSSKARIKELCILMERYLAGAFK